MNEVFSIWGNRSGFVSLPRKLMTGNNYGSKNNEGKWEEQSFPWHGTEKEKQEILSWVSNSIKQGYSIYWCPTVLDKAKRRKESISKVDCFYADLDNIPLDNLSRIPLSPTLLWETSPGRYSAVWKLSYQLDADIAEMINKFITYELDADTGGWDLSQVLRVPRSLNFKYKKPFKGRIIEYEYKPYGPEQVQPLLIHALKAQTAQPMTLEFDENPLDLNEILSSYKLPSELVQTINLSEDYIATQDRSKKLWQIESQLKKYGVSRDDCINIILKSNWNKYKGRKDEYLRVVTEVDKIYQGQSVFTEKAQGETSFLHLTPYFNFMSDELAQPRWLVEDWWQLESHGMVSGEPKTYKSTLITDMMVSIASGTQFLGKFPVHQSGPIIYIQEENAPVLVKDRILKVTNSRDLLGSSKVTDKIQVTMPNELPIYFMNNKGFDLTSDESRDFLHEACKEIQPVMVIFDPLYLMLGDKDENSSKDVRDVLRWLVGLRYQHHTAVVVLHHWNKNSKTERGGQRMLGSTLFHAWVESAIYCSVSNEQQQEITVEREFRSFHKPDKCVIKFMMGAPGDLSYDVRMINEFSTRSESILSLLSQFPDGLSGEKLASIMATSQEKVKLEAAKLNKDGRLKTVVKDGVLHYKLIVKEGTSNG
jgi:hypothetical protein